MVTLHLGNGLQTVGKGQMPVLDGPPEMSGRPTHRPPRPKRLAARRTTISAEPFAPDKSTENSGPRRRRQPHGNGSPILRRPANIVSPLRYPGAKRRFATFVEQTILANDLKPKIFVEPFAGGASVSLQMLEDDVVESAIIGEKDPLLASFWKTVFFDSEWLISQVEGIQPSLRLWDKYKQSSIQSDRGRAIKCLFLNRTSFSGIMHDSAGPIGGRKQESAYAIDCRFPKETLVKRIEMAADLSDKVTAVYCASWQTTLSRAQKKTKRHRHLFAYLDPPFHQKADHLYTHHFKDAQHRELYKGLNDLKSPWLLSYDNSPWIVKLYSTNGLAPRIIELLYSTSRPNGVTLASELVITNLDSLPKGGRIWMTQREWKNRDGWRKLTSSRRVLPH